MAGYHLTGDEALFEKGFNTLCQSRSRWKVWCDFIHLMAYSISNAVDGIHREEREAKYLKIAKGYSPAEMETFVRLFANVVTAIEKNPEQDFLGSLYMHLQLGNEWAGQFFTPYHVSRMMAEMQVDGAAAEIKNKGFITVSDCCIGGGAMLIAFANACRSANINYHNNVLFVGQDIDYTVALMAYIQLSLLGCPGYIVVGNSLTEPLTGDPLFAPMDRETYITPFYASSVWHWRRVWHGLADGLTA